MGRTERIFGFDIGTTSIGWAVIDYDKDAGEGSIVAKDSIPGLGVRIFPEARDPDGTPLNQTRRQKRMMRRQLRRRKARRRLLNQALAEARLLPLFSKDKESEWAKVMGLNPYTLRAKGVAEPLSAHELGRALYALSKRRHFKGRDLEDDDDFLEPDDSGDGAAMGAQKKKRRSKATANGEEEKSGTGDDEKKLKEEIASTHKLLKSRGVTLGQYLAEKNADAKKGKPPTERRRQIHAHRVDVEAEFDALWTEQSKHHAVLKDSALKERVRGIAFHQNPVFWRKATLGTCRFMPDEALCPRGSWLSQQRRMLEKLNNLAIAGGNARSLDDEERAAILADLQTQGSMSWGAVRKLLKPILKRKDQPEQPRFNLELDEGGTLLGNPLEAKLSAIFGDDWEAHPYKQAIRDTVPAMLWAADYGEIGSQRVVIRSSADRKKRRADAAESFIADFGATQEQSAKLRELKLPTGWEPFSTEALKKILVELERGEPFGALVNAANDDKEMRTRMGVTYGAWRDENFPDRNKPTEEELDRLPSPNQKEAKGKRKISDDGRKETQRIATIRNPTVVRAQNELRKVVNNLIRVYGKPALIRVELARDLGKSKRERKEIEDAIRKNERKRKEAIKNLASKGIGVDSRDPAVEKWLLWQEANETCPYTGDKISFDALFREGRYDFEHIWPRHKSFDNSPKNKTLCRKGVNIEKGQRTPYEAFGADQERWASIKDRLNRLMSTKGGPGIPPGKVKRFCREEPIPDDFASRQLNDTGYAARQAVEFLKRLWPDAGPTAPVNVQPVSGKVTAQLRKYWELNNILSDSGEKTRADHRHHAIDALAVACAHPGVTNKLSRYLQQKDEPSAQRPKLPPPWANIRADAEKAVANIVVSHRVRKKVSGPLHKEKPYRDGNADIVSGKVVYREIVQRTPIEALGQKDIDAEDLNSAQYVIRDAGARRAIKDQITRFDGDLKKALAEPVPLGKDNKTMMKNVRVSTKRQLKGLVRLQGGLMDPNAKHHVAIYSNGAVIVSLYEAARRLATRKTVFEREGPDGAKLVFTLTKGDSIQIDDPRASFWIVREVNANGQIALVPHIEARPTKEGVSYKPTADGLMKRQPQKVSVDPIGRVRPARD